MGVHAGSHRAGPWLRPIHGSACRRIPEWLPFPATGLLGVQEDWLTMAARTGSVGDVGEAGSLAGNGRFLSCGGGRSGIKKPPRWAVWVVASAGITACDSFDSAGGMAGAYLQQFRIGIWVLWHIQHDPETVIGQHDGEFVPARVAFDHIDGAIAQRKTQLDINQKSMRRWVRG
jgi:hypothetical protein